MYLPLIQYPSHFLCELLLEQITTFNFISHNFIIVNMCHLLSLLSLLLLALIHLSRFAHGSENIQEDPISFETRAHWMRKANLALSELDSSCPFAAFGTVIVNHTDISTSPHGKLICYSINQNHQTGNPTLHGTFFCPISRFPFPHPKLSLIMRWKNRRDLRDKQLHLHPHRSKRRVQTHLHGSNQSIPIPLALHQRRTLPHVRIRNPVGWVCRDRLRN